MTDLVSSMVVEAVRVVMGPVEQAHKEGWVEQGEEGIFMLVINVIRLIGGG